MTNVVPCKQCASEFEYSPGFSGNARQLCDSCRQLEDRKDLEKEQEECIIEGNKYLVSAPGYKNRYDPSEILVDGIMPNLPDEGEKFACAMEVGQFIKSKDGFMSCEKNIVKFLEHLGTPQSVVCVQQWTPRHMELSYKLKEFKNILKLMPK